MSSQTDTTAIVKQFHASPVGVYTEGGFEVAAAGARAPLNDAAIPAHTHQLGAGGMPAAVPHNVSVVLQLMQHVSCDGIEYVH
jgi:hypothetical protein